MLRSRGLIVIAAAAALALTGCAGDADDDRDDAATTPAPQVTTSGSATPHDDDDLPAEWPAEVPAPDDDDVTTSAARDGVVTVTFDMDDMAEVDAYVGQLEAAGFTATEGVSRSASVTSGVWQSATHDVTLATTPDGDDVALSVTVAPRAS